MVAFDLLYIIESMKRCRSQTDDPLSVIVRECLVDDEAAALRCVRKNIQRIESSGECPLQELFLSFANFFQQNCDPYRVKLEKERIWLTPVIALSVAEAKRICAAEAVDLIRRRESLFSVCKEESYEGYKWAHSVRDALVRSRFPVLVALERACMAVSHQTFYNVVNRLRQSSSVRGEICLHMLVNDF